MADCTIWDGFSQLTESFNRDVYSKPSPPTVLTNVAPKGVFAKNIGLTRTGFRFANIEPTSNTPTWSPMTTAYQGTAGGSCGVDYTTYEGGWDSFTWGPVTLGSKFEILCQTDQYFNYEPEVWLNQYMIRLKKLSMRLLDNYLIDQYMRVVPVAVAVTNGFEVQDASASLTLPRATSELTQDMLDLIALQLIENGATDPDSNGYIMLVQNKLIYSLLIGIEMSNEIMKNNSEFREDIRFAFQGKGDQNPLFRLIGANSTIKNFNHMQWQTPVRFSYNGTTYSQVDTWVNVPATKGVKSVLNPEWKAADFEGALVLSPYVFTQEFIQPASSVGPVTWPNGDYGMAEWKFVTGIDAGCVDDPLHKRGRHFMEWNLALAPGALPESGFLIIYKRCHNRPVGVSCS